MFGPITRNYNYKKIQYDVSIKSPDPSYDHWIQNIEESKRLLLVETMLNAAYDGRLQAYDYFNKPMTLDELRSIGVDTIYKILTRTYPPYEEYDTIITTKLDIHDLNRVRFLEEWTMDQQTLEIEKKVIGIAPVMDKFDGEGSLIAQQPLFWLYLDPNHLKKN